MAASNLSTDDNSGSTSRSRPPLLPRPESGDNVCPVPLWERVFCRKAYNIPWAKFCLNKQFIGLYRNVMNWDDSGALENFEEAKERYRAEYHGEPFADPMHDPDMYIDEIDHSCNVNLGHTPYVTGRMVIGGGTMWIGGTSTGSGMRWNGGGGGSNNSGRNHNGGGGSRNWNGDGGGSGCGCRWNCFGRGNQRKQHEGSSRRTVVASRGTGTRMRGGTR